MGQYRKISETEYAHYFGAGSLLPSVNLKPYVVEHIKIDITYDVKTDTAEWLQSYTVKKVGDVQEEVTDIWWVVTGCPRGGILPSSFREEPGVTFGGETFVDDKDNLIHLIKFDRKHQVEETIKFDIKHTTIGHAKEDKLLVMENRVNYKKLLFRYDRASSMVTNSLEWDFKVQNGKIVEAWPKNPDVRGSKTDYAVSYSKKNLRKQELFTPLIQIECGSKSIAKVRENIVTFVVGVMASLAAAYVYANGVGL